LENLQEDGCDSLSQLRETWLKQFSHDSNLIKASHDSPGFMKSGQLGEFSGE
jgi:hypothetical protein